MIPSDSWAGGRFGNISSDQLRQTSGRPMLGLGCLSPKRPSLKRFVAQMSDKARTLSLTGKTFGTECQFWKNKALHVITFNDKFNRWLHNCAVWRHTTVFTALRNCHHGNRGYSNTFPSDIWTQVEMATFCSCAYRLISYRYLHGPQCHGLSITNRNQWLFDVFGSRTYESYAKWGRVSKGFGSSKEFEQSQ